jgi:ribosomal protein L37AE/L43A
MIDTTERVCPECNGNLKHTVSRLDETDWLCDNCNTRFTVPNLKDWSRIYIKGSSGVVMALWIERSKI